MPFDKLTTEKCQIEAQVDPTTCNAGPGDENGPPFVSPPGDDDRCADPAFYDANPEICAGYPRLILKPEYAITESGKTVQYKTFVRTGGAEHEVTTGLVYSSANVLIAVIEADAGLATGVTDGITTISVSWQNLHAYAQLEVTASCGLLATNFVLLVDDSKSMGQGFSGSYATKLAFAKAMGNQFIDSVNFSKDKVAVYDFDSSATQLLALSSDPMAAHAAVNSIVLTAGKTDFYQALKTVTDYLATQVGVKCIILFSDGEDNGDFDSLPVSKAFKDAGGILVVVATRAWGDFFNFLYKTASAGYFLSAYQATQADVALQLPNLKSYICSGDCPPTAGTSPKAKLNYDGFINWDVTNFVDLVGLGLWDVLPGNGLYVDLAGTQYVSTPGGKLTSKVAYSFVSGQDYKFSIKVAGNNVGVNQIEPVKVTIGTFLTETITPTAIDEPFVLYEFPFTAASTGDANIVIELLNSNDMVGSLIDDITLERTSGIPTVFLHDDFDGENPVTTDPGPGSYYGCITTPPGEQTTDPTPPLPTVQE